MPRSITAAGAALGAVLVLLNGEAAPRAAERAREVRAMWVQRATMTSAASVTALVRTAKGAGINTLMVQVRGRGDAYYRSGIEPRGPALAGQDRSFDPLTLVLAAGHRAGLRVHAWVNVNLVSDGEPPAAVTHIVRTHPEWLMVPRELAGDLDEMPPQRPEYLAALSRYAKDHSDRIEGIYLTPIQPDAADYTVSVIADIAQRYALDGIHLDYARYPNDQFDYSRGALLEFRREVLERASADERLEYEERAEGRPLFYTQMFPQGWQDFRRDRMTKLVTKIRAAVKGARRDLVLSAAVWPDPADAGNRRFQDWRGWLDQQLLDVICPMAYTEDAELFRSQIAGVKAIAGSRPVWAGIGAFQLPAARTVANIKTARQLGAQGVVLFSYDNLTPGVNADRRYLSTVARGAFAR